MAIETDLAQWCSDQYFAQFGLRGESCAASEINEHATAAEVEIEQREIGRVLDRLVERFSSTANSA